MIEVTIREHGRSGKFEAYVRGERVPIQSSNQPFFATARWLLAQGVDPETPLTMHHEGSATISMRSTVGEAAGLTIEETRQHGPFIRRWRPFDRDSFRNRGAEPAGGDSGPEGYDPT